MSAGHVVVVGAGHHQVPLIEHVQGRGFAVIAVDVDPRAPGLSLAEIGLTHDAHDAEGVLAEVTALGVTIVGVVTKAARGSIVTAARLARALNVPGLDPETAALSIDRPRMRRLLEERGLGAIPYRIVGDQQSAVAACDELGFPVCVKPQDRSGAVGITVARDRAGAAAAYTIAKDAGIAAGVVVERFVDGPELGVCLLVNAGNLTPVAIVDRFQRDDLPALSDRWTLPSRLPSHVQDAAVDLARNVVMAIGIDLGPVNVEMRLDAASETLHVLEVEASTQSRIAEVLVPTALDLDLVGLAADCFLPSDGRGAPRAAQRTKLGYSGCGFVYAEPGRVSNITGIEEARAIPHVLRVDCLLSEPREITARDMSSVVADIYAQASDPDDMDRALAEAKLVVEAVQSHG